VGGDPPLRESGDVFHDKNAARLALAGVLIAPRPTTPSARDVRARINVLSEVPARGPPGPALAGPAASRSTWTAARHPTPRRVLLPDLVGALARRERDEPIDAEQVWSMEKATKEAKRHTSSEPTHGYDAATRGS